MFGVIGQTFIGLFVLLAVLGIVGLLAYGLHKWLNNEIEYGACYILVAVLIAALVLSHQIGADVCKFLGGATP